MVSDGLIRYTQFGAFNDPFDGRPHMTALGTDTELRDSLVRIIPEENKRAYESLSAEAKEKVSFEAFSALTLTIAERGTPNIMEIMRDITPRFQEWFHGMLDKHVGILSLTELPDNLLMWSHYSEGHTGFALGFDAQHPYFNAKLSESDELRHVRQVVYRDQRTQAPLTSLNGIEMFLVKSAHWSYEKEWRIARPLEDAELIQNESPFPIHLFRFPSDALKEIIFGAKIDPTTKQTLLDIASDRSDFEHLVFRQAVLDQQSYSIKLDEITI